MAGSPSPRRRATSTPPQVLRAGPRQLPELDVVTSLIEARVERLDARFDDVRDQLEEVRRLIAEHTVQHNTADKIAQQISAQTAQEAAARAALITRKGDWLRKDLEIAVLTTSVVVTMLLFGLNLAAHHYGLT